MEALLIDEWLEGLDAAPVLDEASISGVRVRVREAAVAEGLSREDGERLATAASELARNQLRHASGGRIAVRAIRRGAARGVEIIAADRGPGIADPTRAVEGVVRERGSLGVGVASVCDLADEVDFDVRIGEGTCVWARKLAPGAPRAHQIGIFGRAIAGELRSGDHAGFARLDAGVVVALCDGLGHGMPARTASTTALAVFREEHERSPSDILDACHRALGPTRGAVMAVARTAGEELVEAASVGNVTTEIVGPRASKRFGGSSFILGSNQRGHRLHAEALPIARGQSIVLFSDGISSRASIEEDPALLVQHPIVIAHQIAQRFGKESDDLLVLVARRGSS